MFNKIFILMAFLVMSLFFFSQNAFAQEIEIFHDFSTRTTYYVEDSSISYTNYDIAFKAKVLVYEKTYSPQEKFYFFDEEEDGTVAYVVGEGGMAHTVKRTDEPAYSIFKFCLKYLNQNEKNLTGA